MKNNLYNSQTVLSVQNWVLIILDNGMLLIECWAIIKVNADLS